MGNNRLILKATSFLLIGVMVYMHVCSAWCVMVPDRNCCSKAGKERSERTCCSHHKDSKHEEKGCQNFHLAFFKATGQFSSEKNVEVDKVFSLFPAVLFSAVEIRPCETNNQLITFNQYHPPPLITDIRMFIQSLQI